MSLNCINRQTGQCTTHDSLPSWIFFQASDAVNIHESMIPATVNVPPMMAQIWWEDGEQVTGRRTHFMDISCGTSHKNLNECSDWLVGHRDLVCHVYTIQNVIDGSFHVVRNSYVTHFALNSQKICCIVVCIVIVSG